MPGKKTLTTAHTSPTTTEAQAPDIDNLKLNFQYDGTSTNLPAVNQTVGDQLDRYGPSWVQRLFEEGIGETTGGRGSRGTCVWASRQEVS